MTPEPVPDRSRFHRDPEAVLGASDALPPGWAFRRAGATDVDEVTALLRRHERRGRGWASSGEDDVEVELSGLRTRENLLVVDAAGHARGWASAHDRAAGRMLLVAIVDRDLDDETADRVATVLFAWAERQAQAVGARRGLAVQQIDTGAFAADERHHRWLAAAGYERVRSWWQMSRPVTPEEAGLVDDPTYWERDGVVCRRVRRAGDGMPEQDDLRAVHDVLETAFADHFNSHEESFDEFVHRLREDPGHRWDHWWLAELVDAAAETEPVPVGALVATVSPGGEGRPDGSYVAYIGVLEEARGRGVASGLLRTVIADAAARARDRVGLEVDADSPTGADGLYVAMGWETRYVTESWHLDVPVR